MMDIIDQYSIKLMDCGLALGTFFFSIEEAEDMKYQLKCYLPHRFKAGSAMLTPTGSVGIEYLPHGLSHIFCDI
jgi:hypothetical protein